MRQNFGSWLLQGQTSLLEDFCAAVCHAQGCVIQLLCVSLVKSKFFSKFQREQVSQLKRRAELHKSSMLGVGSASFELVLPPGEILEGSWTQKDVEVI